MKRVQGVQGTREKQRSRVIENQTLESLNPGILGPCDEGFKGPRIQEDV